MVTFQTFRRSFLPSFSASRPRPDVNALRETCFGLLADVPASDRKAMLQRLERMRRADDVWHLRAALFETIARVHGEATARERLSSLDSQLP
jgi:hypothetical protein